MAWNPSPRIKAFLAAYKETCSITRAGEAAKVSRSAHYRLLERCEEYKAAFEKAELEATAALEDEAVRRAREGTYKPVMYHGKQVCVPRDPTKRAHKRTNPKQPLFEREYSDQLLLALLKAKKPAEYRERVEHTGKDGAPIDALLEVVFVTAADHANRVPPEAAIPL